ncbi:MAG: hypothetical protein Q9203_001391 [Teloschistes exilis]
MRAFTEYKRTGGRYMVFCEAAFSDSVLWRSFPMRTVERDADFSAKPEPEDDIDHYSFSLTGFALHEMHHITTQTGSSNYEKYTNLYNNADTCTIIAVAIWLRGSIWHRGVANRYPSMPSEAGGSKRSLPSLPDGRWRDVDHQGNGSLVDSDMIAAPAFQVAMGGPRLKSEGIDPTCRWVGEVEEKEENEENLSIALDNQLHVFGLKMQAKPGISSHRNAVVGGGCGIHSLLDEAMTGVSTFDEAREGHPGGTPLDQGERRDERRWREKFLNQQHTNRDHGETTYLSFLGYFCCFRLHFPINSLQSKPFLLQIEPSVKPVQAIATPPCDPRISLARSYLIYTVIMTSKLSNALPARLQSGLSNGDAEGAFKQKHHGKSQSHVVSRDFMIVDRPESSDSFNRKMTYFKITTQHTLLGCHSVESWWHVVSFYTIFRATK